VPPRPSFLALLTEVPRKEAVSEFRLCASSEVGIAPVRYVGALALDEQHLSKLPKQTRADA
jgi:hypothetical protein